MMTMKIIRTKFRRTFVWGWWRIKRWLTHCDYILMGYDEEQLFCVFVVAFRWMMSRLICVIFLGTLDRCRCLAAIIIIQTGGDGKPQGNRDRDLTTRHFALVVSLSLARYDDALMSRDGFTHSLTKKSSMKMAADLPLIFLALIQWQPFLRLNTNWQEDETRFALLALYLRQWLWDEEGERERCDALDFSSFLSEWETKREKGEKFGSEAIHAIHLVHKNPNGSAHRQKKMKIISRLWDHLTIRFLDLCSVRENRAWRLRWCCPRRVPNKSWRRFSLLLRLFFPLSLSLSSIYPSFSSTNTTTITTWHASTRGGAGGKTHVESHTDSAMIWVSNQIFAAISVAVLLILAWASNFTI